jgi:2-dehydro-3-deoxy-L-rhamnonate dehydrogenase (NAD+)
VVSKGRTGIKSHDVELADFERVFAVNNTGTFLMCKAVLVHMLKQGPKGSGRICNIASISGKEGNAGMLAYSASKAAVRGLSMI